MPASLLPLLLAGPAWAQSLRMDPQVRVHAGLSWVAGPAGLGVALGTDARLNRLLHVDVGGVFTPVRLPMPDDPPGGGAFHLRDALWVLPGVRVPHRQPQGFHWELFLRAGPAVAWSAWEGPLSTPVDLAPVEADTAGVAGADLHLERGPLGLVLSGRGVVARPYDRLSDTDRWQAWPQAALELSWRF